MKYSSSELLKLRNKGGSLPVEIFYTVKQNGLLVSRRKRGRRAGAHIQRFLRHSSGLDKNGSFSTNPVTNRACSRFALWNARSLRSKTSEISEFIISQKIDIMAHRGGHTLDLIISRNDDDFISNIDTTSYLTSDHAVVMCSLEIGRPPLSKIEIKTRKLNQINLESFRRDILSSPLYTSPVSNLDQLVDMYERVLTDLLDKHAPVMVCKNDLKSYRPIANLKFLAKTIERVCSKQIQNYLRNNKLLGEKQSAYRAHHSTETALLRVYNDLLLTADKGEEAILVLLDYSAAFDTINHDIFFQRLQNRYGVSGNALCWFKSYFTNRSQAVVVNDCISNVHKPVGGVPQGSVMGPLSFTMYTSPVEDIIKAHGMSGMLYADDTQVYAIKSGCDHGATLAKLGACISDIRSWSAANDMKLNDDKTELIHISSKFRTAAPIPSLKIGTTHVEPVNNARNLGVIFDKNLDMNQHINNICRSASSALHKIGKIRRCLDQQTAETLVHAFVSSRVTTVTVCYTVCPISR
ncbi:putative RNA-directed DNA polymerase from mobile element jockey-like [Apostichopus japonicus]|uniref:Putative RNA-directed DNA polymerase from mobile element jockey-like n=1 Tax=Stichopus japonicus TaxID=307972 RepID=A0A2G8KL41_STIJA|nr:putative RNA-directed DNA polymerase from mobile element jockey-like [Apostichopus japonicus]